jgi:ABC-type cobalamin transport system ATPase subunit
LLQLLLLLLSWPGSIRLQGRCYQPVQCHQHHQHRQYHHQQQLLQPGAVPLVHQVQLHQQHWQAGHLLELHLGLLLVLRG